MTAAKEIGIEMLIGDARRSCIRESYVVLERNSRYQIGVGAAIGDDGEPSLFIEVTIALCQGRSSFNMGVLEKSAVLAGRLKERGYALTCIEGYVTCEKFIDEDELNSEYAHVRRIIGELGIE